MGRYLGVVKTKDPANYEKWENKCKENFFEDKGIELKIFPSFEELINYIFYNSYDKDFSHDLGYNVVIFENPESDIKKVQRIARVEFSFFADSSLPFGSDII